MKTTQLIEFECCYISQGKLNAHRYRAEVTVSGLNNYIENGYVVRFEKFKEYLSQVVPDGVFLYSARDDESLGHLAQAMSKCGVPVMMLPTALSCETLCEYIATELQSVFYASEPGVAVRMVRLRETPDSFAIWGGN